MSKEKQILLCCASGFSQRRTADTLGVSRNTVSAAVAAAKRQHISAQAAELMDEPDLILKLFPEKAFEPTQEIPDFDKIHKELLRSGVTLRILWDVYRDIYCKFSSLHKIFYRLIYFCLTLKKISSIITLSAIQIPHTAPI